jgi:hypothetical protein
VAALLAGCIAAWCVELLRVKWALPFVKLVSVACGNVESNWSNGPGGNVEWELFHIVGSRMEFQ